MKTESGSPAPSEVSIADAMLFETPNIYAWRVLVGVVDALEQQLDSKDFALAVDALAAYAERFPDDLRTCPRAWFNIFFDEAPDPRLKLVRRLDLFWSTFGWSGKNFASWVSMLAKTSHLSDLSSIGLFSMQSGKGALTALVELFTAAQPTSWRFLNGKSRFDRDLVAALEAAGVTPKRIEGYRSDDHAPERSDAAAFDAAEVFVRIQDEETFAAVMARDDLDHVVSLRLNVNSGWDGASQVSSDQVATPRWKNLRYLSVSAQLQHDPTVTANIIRWLQNARPICVDVNEHQITTPLIQNGVFQRALGSELRMHDLPDAQEALSTGLVRVMGLIHAENTPYLEGTVELLSHLHPDTCAALRVLDWGLPESEFTRVEEICAALPKLVIWCPHETALTNNRQAFVQQLAASPSSRKLCLLIPYEPYCSTKGKTPALAARHVKLLNKGQGLRAGAYVTYNHSSYPYRITW